jgi:GDP-L-fucose synthase
MMDRNAKIYVAGHTGMIGSAILTKLRAAGFSNILVKTHRELDLIRQAAVEKYFDEVRPEYVILMAAKVGGIGANIKYPAEFIYENIAIQTNVIHAAFKAGVKKLLFFGSSCSYPLDAAQPISEDSFFSGRVESTSEPLAAAKIAGIKMCQAYNAQYNTNYICAIPASPFGPGEHFDPEKSHVVGALIHKFHSARVNHDPVVILWGTGKPLREFIYVDDLADASLFLMEKRDRTEIVNISTGVETSIGDLANAIREVIGYEGDVVYDHSKPDGAMRKLLDNARINSMGWKARVSLKDGIRQTYDWYCKNVL